MKKFLCYLCVLCLIVSTMACIQAPLTAKADEPTAEYPATVTAIAFSDPGTWPEANDLCEVKVTTGAAITLGGQSYWNYGMIIIEPNEGYSVISVGTDNGDSLDISTLGAVWGTVTGTSEAIPGNVESTVHSYADAKPDIPAVYIPRSLYDTKSLGYKNIIIQYNDGTQQIIEGKPDSIMEEATVNVGDTVDTSELFADVFGLSINKSDYSVDYGAGNSTSNDAMEQDDTDPFVFTCKMGGEWSIMIQNKHTGLEYELWLELNVEGAPLEISEFTLSDNASMREDTSVSGMIYPLENEVVLKHLELSFTLPEGATMNWEETKISGDDESGAALRDNGSYGGGYYNEETGQYDISYESDGATQKFIFNAEKALYLPYTIGIDYNGRTFVYSFFTQYNRIVSIGMTGYKTYTYLPNTVIPVFDLFHCSEEIKPKFIEAVNEGKIFLDPDDCSGMEFLFENGGFTGNMIIYRPVKYLNIRQNPFGALGSCNINIQIKANTVATPGQTVDLRDILNGYNGESKIAKVYKFGTEIGNEYLDGMTFTAPQLENNEPVIYYVKFLSESRSDEVEAIVNVTVLPENNVTESIGDVIESLDDNDELVMDSQTTGGVIPKEFFVNLTNIKSNGKGNVKIKIKEKNNNNPHNVSWTFEADDIASAANADIKPGVKVNDELNDAELDRQLQKANATALKIGFEENGKLPGKSTIRIYLTEDDLAKLGNKKNIELYYFKNGKFEKESGDYYVVNDKEQNLYYIEFEVTHNSEFVLSGTPIVNPTDPVTPGPSGPTGPSGPSAPVIISGGGEGDVSTPAGDTTAVEEEKKDETQKDTSAEQPEVKETPAPKVKVGDEKVSGGNTYKVTGSKKSAKTVAVSTAEANKEEVKLPAKVKIGGESYAVTEISKNTFKNNDTIKTVKTGTSIAKIGKAAFKGCDALESVNLGKNVDTIGANAFSGCGNLTSINIFSRKLTVESFGKNAFKGISKDCVFFVPKGYVKKYRAMFKELGYSFTVKMMQK